MLSKMGRRDVSTSLICCPFHTTGGQGGKPGKASPGFAEQSCQGLSAFGLACSTSEGKLQQKVSEMP